MKILKAINTDNGKPEVFFLDKIISIKPHGDGIKILAGAGLYWTVDPVSVTVEDLGYTELENLLKGGCKL